MRRFTPAQRRIFIGCFVAYAGAYIGRLNLSAALSGVAASLRITDAQAGLIQTLFALAYAAGQLINGALVDRISARRFIVIGLIASALVNALFAAAREYWMLPVLWLLNGAAQSMLWTPIVKLLSVWYQGEARQRASFGMSLTLIVGHLTAWAVAGYMAGRFGWRLSFAIPAATLALAALCAWALIRDGAPAPEAEASEESEAQAAGAVGAPERMAVAPMLFSTGLLLMLLACVTNGYVRDGIVTWAPTILVGLGKSVADSPVALSLIIPVLNFFGVLIGRQAYRHLRCDARLTAALMMGAGGALAALLLGAMHSMVLCALALGCCCALMSGVNPMLTVMVPMEYDAVRRVGLVAGLMDCFIYLGSSLSGVLAGALSDQAGWQAVFAGWAIVALSGMTLAFLSMRARRNIRLM